MKRAIPLVQSYDDALELVPTNTLRKNALLALTRAVGDRLPSTRTRLDALARAGDPDSIEPLMAVVSDATTDLQAGDAAPWCADRSECIGPALSAVIHLAALQPGRCGPHVEKARLELAAGAPSALRDLEAEAETAADPSVCWRSLGEMALSSKSDRYVTIAEEALTRAGCGADAECADNLVWAASMEERRGNYRRAMSYYARAQERAPDRVDLLEQTARLASALEFHAEALEAYRKLSRLSPDAEKWRALAEREKALVQGAIPTLRPP